MSDLEQHHTVDFDQAVELMRNNLDCPILPLLIPENSVSQAIIKLTQQQEYALVVLGASNEGLLQNVIKGNIPEAIAHHANSTVIIFRSSAK
jgi:CIC family chloride channel protein